MFQRPARRPTISRRRSRTSRRPRAANGGASPPDLSLIAKARAVERGFPTLRLRPLHPVPGDRAGLHLLAADRLPGAAGRRGGAAGQLLQSLFPRPGARDAAAASDGRSRRRRRRRRRPETVDQYAKDVTAFLMWAAEPHLVERKRLGLHVMVFLIILAGLVYYTKKKVWRRSSCIRKSLSIGRPPNTASRPKGPSAALHVC